MDPSPEQVVGNLCHDQAIRKMKNSSGEITPHIERLLRLIEGGSEETVDVAVDQLFHICVEEGPILQWRILGRIQTTLCSGKSSWKARTQAAIALERVAHLVPRTDQKLFWEQSFNSQINSSEEKAAASTRKRRGEQEDHFLFISLDDINCDRFWSNLAQSGRHLYATASTKWEEDELAYEQDMLKEMMSKVSEQDSVVQLRTRWQRVQLAKRLGLRELLVVSNEVDFIQHDDLALTDSHRNPRKRPRNAKRLHSEVDKKSLDLSTSNMQDLLVEQFQRVSTKQRKSQLDSQYLLATEFLYNMWSPSWMVRHGSLLGLLALVRAWQAALKETSVHPRSWSQDLLARSIALLALDRFGDFSGAFLIEETDEKNTISSRFHGGVVAPVRETAGQLVAVLFMLLTDKIDGHSVKHRIISSMDHCLNAAQLVAGTSLNAWESRHGILVALKYISVLLWREMGRKSMILSNRGERHLLSNQTTDDIQALNHIIKAAISHLDDPSDDVVSAAAHLLRENTKHLTICHFEGSSEIALNPSILGPHVYEAIAKAKAHSSSIPDLIGLLAELLAHKPEATIDVSKACGLDHFIDMLLGLLNSDFESVQGSALKALGSLSIIVETEAKLAHGISRFDTHKGQEATLLKLFGRVLSRLFTASPQFERSESKRQMVQTWQKICKAMQFISQSAKDEFHMCERELYLQFFTHPDLSSISGYFHFIEISSDLLVFLSSNTPDPFPTKELHSLLAIHLKSPWIGQCEAACLLVSKLAGQPGYSSDTLEFIETNIEHTVTSEVAACLNENASRVWSNPPIFQLCNEAMRKCFSDNDLSDSTTVKNVLSIWDRFIRVRDGQGEEGMQRYKGPSLDVLSMRLKATASSAALALGIPRKITPFVRPLMTSLKSESCRLRLAMTVDTIVRLLGRMESMPEYRAAFIKIFGSITQAAITESHTNSPEVYKPACEGLGGLASNMSANELFDKSNPTWRWLQNLSSAERECSKEKLLSSIHLVRVLCSQVSKNGNDTIRSLARQTQEKLLLCALKDDDEDVRTTAESALLTMCVSKDIRVLQLILRGTVLLLSGDPSQDIRIRCCRLISSVADITGTLFRHFVRGLLPTTMRMMRDKSSECSTIATKIFACLVQLAPLVQLEDSLDLELTSEDSHTSAVIDHLILGLPIPPCKLPTDVSNALSQSGIELRTYQMEGISWLHFLQRIYLNGALCDSMGLGTIHQHDLQTLNARFMKVILRFCCHLCSGKTLQALVAIALAHSREIDSPLSLIVCPSTLVGHWISETEKLFPGDKVFQPIALVGSVSSRKKFWKSLIRGKNLIVTSYAVLRSDIDHFEKINFTYCCLDEAHLLRNPKTATSKASRRISSVHRLILSGTMIQNRVDDLWAAFDFLMPNFLGTSKYFVKEYGAPIAKSQSISATAEEIRSGREKLKALHQKVLPFILRREKEQVLTELPPKNVMVLKCRMSEAQGNIYSSFMSSREMRKSIASLQRALDVNDGKGSALGSDVLKTLFFMRLLCTHPALISTQKMEVKDRPAIQVQDSGKLLALAEIFRSLGIEEQVESAADNDTSILYCRPETEQDPDAFSSVCGSASFAPIADQGLPSYERKQSKCLVFAQFSQSLDVVEEALLIASMSSSKYLRMDGSVPTSRRGEIANRFNSDPSIRILLLTTRVGSLGLNLTGADTVVSDIFL